MSDFEEISLITLLKISLRVSESKEALKALFYLLKRFFKFRVSGWQFFCASAILAAPMLDTSKRLQNRQQNRLFQFAL